MVDWLLGWLVDWLAERKKGQLVNWSAEEIATKNSWIQESDSDALSEFIQQAIAKYPEKVEEYKKGKKGLIGLFMGEVMKLSNGKADPKLCNQMLRVLLGK